MQTIEIRIDVKFETKQLRSNDSETIVSVTPPYRRGLFMREINIEKINIDESSA